MTTSCVHKQTANHGDDTVELCFRETAACAYADLLSNKLYIDDDEVV
jgi:hypothetical protein